MFGCASRPPAGSVVVERDGRPVVVVPGDWDDVRAAAGVAVGEIEAAILRGDVGATEASFELRTINDEPGVLEVRRVPDGIQATARVGRFSDPGREKKLLASFAHRLEQLHGVEYAPR